ARRTGRFPQLPHPCGVALRSNRAAFWCSENKCFLHNACLTSFARVAGSQSNCTQERVKARFTASADDQTYAAKWKMGTGLRRTESRVRSLSQMQDSLHSCFASSH